jgi:hypothetical protein
MNRRLILVAASTTLISLSPAQQERAGNPRMSTQPSNSAYQVHRQAAIQMNELAGHIRSLDDSRMFVDMIATVFADDLPPEWATRSIRDRVAHAEYESATDPARLVPEQRIVDAWNKYVQEIGAPEEALVNVAEIHNLRDGYYISARLLWRRGSQNIWTMPNIYAVVPNEKVADGCRAVETLRTIWDIANQFENLRCARERVQKGTLVSDWFRQLQETPASGQGQSEVRFQAVMRDNPVEAAEMRYVREHGETGLSHAIEGLIHDLFPPQTEG